MTLPTLVAPAKAGAHAEAALRLIPKMECVDAWIPAFAGMTKGGAGMTKGQIAKSPPAPEGHTS
jgi:hypothetical protein